MIELFDTHFHYYNEDNVEDFCRELPAEYKFTLMANGANYAESVVSRTFAEQCEFGYFAVGVHPSAAAEFDSIKQFEEFKNHPKLRAIGELGLDFYYENATGQIQRKVFEAFLALALEWRLPAIVHCRDQEGRFNAYNECYAMLREFASGGGSFVVHCFSGTPDYAEKFLELGAYLGVTGIVTFPKAANIRETLKVIPDERMLIETDSPYLAPVPFRGKTNHPKYVAEVAKYIARERNVDFETIAAITAANGHKFFNIGR